MAILTKTVIGRSRAKVMLLMAGSIIFVTVGVFLFQIDSLLANLVGLISLIFFGAGVIFCIVMLFDRSPGLILNEEGITDNSSLLSVGFIPWAEIIEIGHFESFNQKMFLIYVSKPEKYILMGNKYQRIMRGLNMNMCGTPLFISPMGLIISYAELFKILDAFLQAYKVNQDQ